VSGFLGVIDSARQTRGAALMGVLNVTPDSFFDGARYMAASQAEARVAELVAEGADIIDVGGESSRPGAAPVAAREQLERIEPAVRAAVRAGVMVSIDTTRPEVAEAALHLGAHAVNDVSCLGDPGVARVAARAGADLVLMHSRGALGSMPGFSEYPDDGYADVVAEVLEEWTRARERAVAEGLPPDRVLLDPGLGFAKNARQSFELLARLAELRQAGARIVLGPSRKSFIAAVDPCPPSDRLGGTIAACLIASVRGVSVLRVHDVRAVRQALLVTRAVGARAVDHGVPAEGGPSEGVFRA
jgi:dihydropteroate synthase